MSFPRESVLGALGIALVAIGALGLVPGIELGLTLGHDLVHLAPGLALVWAGFGPTSARQTRTWALVTGGFYLGVGLLSLAVPGRVAPLLGIAAWANLVHLGLGGGLLALGLELELLTGSAGT